jgi:uncharacterized membrane protein (UPF0127 family)
MKQGWLLREGTVLAAAESGESYGDRSKGLIGRTGYEGALFLPHTRSVHTLFMRFAIDVGFLDRDGVVLRTVRVAPWRIALPRRGVRGVVEAEAGSFERWGVSPGDTLEFRDTK